MKRDEQATRTDDDPQREAGERIPNSQLALAPMPVTLPTRLIYRRSIDGYPIALITEVVVVPAL